MFYTFPSVPGEEVRVPEIRQIPIDFTETPTYEATYYIEDDDVTPTSNIIGNAAYVAAPGRDLDEAEIEPILVAFQPQNGSFLIRAWALEGPVTGAYMINYSIG